MKVQAIVDHHHNAEVSKSATKVRFKEPGTQTSDQATDTSDADRPDDKQDKEKGDDEPRHPVPDNNKGSGEKPENADDDNEKTPKKQKP